MLNKHTNTCQAQTISLTTVFIEILALKILYSFEYSNSIFHVRIFGGVSNVPLKFPALVYSEITSFSIIVDVNVLDGAVAWQSSPPPEGSTANKALDGVTESYTEITTSCFYQAIGNSYWAVEFGSAGYVKEVVLYLYSLGSCEFYF